MMIIFLCFFHRDLVIANTNNPSFSEGNELYTEVQDTEDQNKEKQKPYIDQRTENPLYGDADAVFNPIYDRYVSLHTKIWNKNKFQLFVLRTLVPRLRLTDWDYYWLNTNSTIRTEQLS